MTSRRTKRPKMCLQGTIPNQEPYGGTDDVVSSQEEGTRYEPPSAAAESQGVKNRRIILEFLDDNQPASTLISMHDR